jgi:hypothetical protein
MDQLGSILMILGKMIKFLNDDVIMHYCAINFHNFSHFHYFNYL